MAMTPQDPLALPAVVDLDALDEIRDRLLVAIDRGPVTVSGSAVERISTNALLMLVSAAETARRNNFTFSIAAASAPMRAAIARLGFDAPLAAILKG